MTKDNFTVNNMNDFITFIQDCYNENAFGFKTLYLQAIANVNPIPPGTDPTVVYYWNVPEDQALSNLCDFFTAWYQWNPSLSTGLEFIQKFSWLYYENQSGLNFIQSGIGYLMTYFFVEINATKMNSSESIPLVNQWEAAIGPEGMSQYIIPPGGYTCFNDFFSRELKIPRPISNPADDSVVVSPADAIVNIIADDLVLTDPLPVKTQELNVLELLNNSPNAHFFEGGTAVSNILMPTVYHRFHSPVSGQVIESNQDVRGVYFGIKDFPELIDKGNVGYGYDYSVFEDFRRGYLIIETQDYGKVAMIPVGLNTIASVIFDDKFKNIENGTPAQSIAKGEEVGYFQYGGSLNILLFEPGVFPSVRIPQGQIIGTMNKKSSTQVKYVY